MKSYTALQYIKRKCSISLAYIYFITEVYMRGQGDLDLNQGAPRVGARPWVHGFTSLPHLQKGVQNCCLIETKCLA